MTHSKAVLAASTGGHLEQLVRLRPQLPIDDDPLWVTFDHPQSRSLLAGERVEYVPYLKPRDFKGAITGMPAVMKLLRDENFDLAISTGAAIAGVVLPAARLLGKDSWYIESISRTLGPSLTGRLVKRVPGVTCMTQHQRWAGAGWAYRYSVLSDYVSAPSSANLFSARSAKPKIYVTLGTIQPYRFDRLIDRLKAILPSGADVVWQLGATERTDVPGKAILNAAPEEHRAYIEWADVIVSHSGVGTALQILDAGKSPVLVPRSKDHNEHVDDHQRFIVEELSNRGLIVTTTIESLNLAVLEQASRIAIRRPDSQIPGGTA